MLNDQKKKKLFKGKPSTSSSRVYEKQCIFCEKKEKYTKGSKSRKGLILARQLRVDDTVRRVAEIKQDTRILALASRELVAAEAHWHHSCYKNYTRENSKSVNTADTEELRDSYTQAELNAFSRLCDYIRNDLFQNSNIIELVKLSDMLKGWMLESGVMEIKPSTMNHLRRKLSIEFGDSLHFIQNESNKVIVYPDGYAGSASSIKPPSSKGSKRFKSLSFTHWRKFKRCS